MSNLLQLFLKLSKNRPDYDTENDLILTGTYILVLKYSQLLPKIIYVKQILHMQFWFAFLQKYFNFHWYGLFLGLTSNSRQQNLQPRRVVVIILLCHIFIWSLVVKGALASIRMFQSHVKLLQTDVVHYVTGVIKNCPLSRL